MISKPAQSETPFIFDVEGETLRGHRHRPDEASERGIVLLHGFGGSSIGPHRLFVGFARRAAARGWHVLRFDHRGRGTSDGEIGTAGMSSMTRDGAEACRVFRREAGLSHLVALGLCSGAIVALAAGQEADVDAFVLWSPDFPPIERRSTRSTTSKLFHHVRSYAGKALSPERWAKLLRGEVDFRGVGKVFAGELGDRRVARSASWVELCLAELQAASGGPALVVHAGGDPEAKESSAFYTEHFSASGRPHQTSWVEEANHNFYSWELREELWRVTVDFLEADAG